MFDSDEDRRKLTGRFGLSAVVAWVIAESLFELLFGPHVRLVRSLALGSGIGAAAGLLSSGLQWLALRGHVRDAGRLVPATTAGSTLAGLLGGLLLYTLINNVELYRLAVPLQGAAGAVFVGLVTSLGQWAVLRGCAVSRHGWRNWAATAATGAALGAVCACIAAASVMGALGGLLGRGAWPYIWIAAYLAGGIVGGIVFGRFITLALRQILPGATVEARAPRRAAQAEGRTPLRPNAYTSAFRTTGHKV
jgi:hypothetical protein